MNPRQTVIDAYVPKTPGQAVGGFMRPVGALSLGALAKQMDRGPLYSGALGAGMGGVLGLGGMWLLNRFTRPDRRRSPLLGAFGGALLGGAGLAMGSHAMERNYQFKQRRKGWEQAKARSPDVFKSASMVGGDHLYIIDELMGAGDVSEQAKRHMVSLVQQLPPDKASQLASILRTAFGSAIGVVIAKYLLGLNMGGMLLSGIIGGALSLSGGGNRNRVGLIHF